jgi:two-component system NtrC family sensor kinase
VSISTEWAINMPLAFFDKGKLQQAVLNILINAIQASKKGGAVEIKTVLSNANHAKIIVSDSGDGISGANLKFVFDPFFTTKQQGTGLGLSIVRSIMKSHNGDISISTKIGEGTQVSMEFPVR